MNNLDTGMLSVGNNLFQYVVEINKIPMLTEKEELFYAKEKDKGNLNAAKILVSSHLRLVVKIANKYKNYGLPMMDLISEGNIGLMRAVKTFDYKKGYKLEKEIVKFVDFLKHTDLTMMKKGYKLATYSMWWIKAYIQEYILKTWSIVKIGTNATQKKLFFNLKKIKNEILTYTSRKYLTNSDVKKISNALNVSEQDVIDMDTRTTKGDLFLNNKSKTEDDTEIIDLIPSNQALQDVVIDRKRTNSKNSQLLKKSLSILNDREREIIEMRRLTDNPLTLAEISKKCNISGERVRQIEAKAIEKMKDYVLKNN